MTLYELQQQVKEFDERFGWGKDPLEHTLLHMQEELGEVSRTILKGNGYKGSKLDVAELEDELADLLYLLVKLANSADADLIAAWKRIDDRYEAKKNRMFSSL